MASVSGYTGFHGINPYTSVGFGQILRRINFIYAAAAEARRGRFGLVGDLSYLDAQAGVSGTGLVSRVGLELQSFTGELFLAYRLVQGSCGWLDLLGGFRFTYVGEQTGLNANTQVVDATSTQLVNLFAQQLATPGSKLRTLVQQRIVDQLTSLEGRNPPLPVGPIAGNQPGVIRDAIETLIQSRQPELRAAIRAGLQGRVTQLKAELAKQVANVLTSHLNRTTSFYDDWFDPLIGLRGRLDLSKPLYLTGETDIGGFGIGSDIAWQGYLALGCQLSRHVYSELGFRALYDDFRDESANGFFYQTWTYGPQIMLGLNF